MKHSKYLWYLIRHKWWVMYYSWKLGIPFRGIVHDLSKFLPSEWFPYVEAFYGYFGYSLLNTTFGEENIQDRIMHRKIMSDFDIAWLKHQHRNKHHWQYWILREDCGDTKLIPIPDKYLREMLADWLGAGRAITGKEDVWSWYDKNSQNIIMNPESKAKIERWIIEKEWTNKEGK